MSSFYLECYTGLKWFKENIQYQFESTKVFLSKFLSQDFCYKMRQLLQISTILLQNATFITNCDRRWSKFIGEQTCGSVITENILRLGCSPVNLRRIFRTLFLKSTSRSVSVYLTSVAIVFVFFYMISVFTASLLE